MVRSLSIFILATGLALSASFSFLESSNATSKERAPGVWIATSEWNEANEAKYAEWVRTDFTEDFFLNGPWGPLKTDCADAIYGARIIFSYLNALPFSLGSSYPKFDNRSTAFDHIADPIQRVRAFVEAVNNRTWTGSLSRHTYPVEVSRASIVPGILWMKPGHVEMVRDVSLRGVVELRGSWLPADVRKMITLTTLGYAPVSPAHGFRRWIWPQNIERPVEDQPGYSAAQFVTRSPDAGRTHFDEAMEIRNFDEDVQVRLSVAANTSGKKISETTKEKIARRAQDFCNLLSVRWDVVQSGFETASSAGRCLNDTEYFAYSTPSRDAALRRLVIDLGLLLGNDLGKIRKALSGCVSQNTKSADDDNNPDTIEPANFYKKILTLDFSSDPHERPSVRFGQGTESSPCRR